MFELILVELKLVGFTSEDFFSETLTPVAGIIAAVCVKLLLTLAELQPPRNPLF